VGRVTPRLLAGAIAVAISAGVGAGAASARVSAASASSTCQGRFLLQCGEKQQILADDITWAHAYILDFEMFETKTSLPLYNPALNQFWHFEAATAAARGELEYLLGGEVTDQDFEQLPTILQLPPPSVRPHKVVNRRLARTLSRLMSAEQQEVVDLEALVTAMDRATFARYSASRQDWMRWQEAAAAGFARQMASALGHVISAQKAAAAGLVAKHLFFGVGTTDLKLAQRRVRKHGLARGLLATMQHLGLSANVIANIVKGFISIKPTAISFSLSELLAAPRSIAREQQMQAALRHFAARIPPAGHPPS
jgi:hypothetical protein